MCYIYCHHCWLCKCRYCFAILCCCETVLQSRSCSPSGSPALGLCSPLNNKAAARISFKKHLSSHPRSKAQLILYSSNTTYENEPAAPLTQNSHDSFFLCFCTPHSPIHSLQCSAILLTTNIKLSLQWCQHCQLYLRRRGCSKIP